MYNIYIYIYISVRQCFERLNTQKMVLDAALLNTQYCKLRIKSKWSNPGNRVTPSSAPWCCSYRKGSLLVTFVYDWLNYLTNYIYIGSKLLSFL